MKPFGLPRIALLFSLLFITLQAGAQQLWNEQAATSQGSFMGRNSRTLPDRVKFYKLNATLLRSKMLSARSFTGTDGGATTELQFPLADGSFIDADVYESSILSPQLQALIPGVKTYMLVDKTTKNSVGRITIVANGISGILFTDKGTAYINPVDEGEDKTHITYFAKEIHIPEVIACGVTDLLPDGSHRPFNPARVQAGDGHLRTYRLAVSATGEYYIWAASSQPQALTYITICINQVTAIYERDATIRFTLVTNNNIIYTDPATDPYVGTVLNGALLTANQTSTDANLGVPYDVGIVFNNGFSGGLAQLSSVCTASKARAGAGITFGFGANPTPGPQGPGFDGTVAHEIGHQFSATHTMSSNTGGCAGNTTAPSAWEPGGGSTIMAYAGTCTGTAYQSGSDLYFHVGNVAQIAAYATTGNGNICPVNTTLSNAAPTVTVAAPSYTIPVSTPFFLTANGADVNGNSLTYTWEQMDANNVTSAPPVSTATTGPMFRSYPPSGSNTRYLPDIPSIVAGFAPTYEVLPSVARTMNFRVNVRDNVAGGGDNAQADIAVNTSVASAPFLVTSQSSPVTLAADGSTTFTVTWDVGSTTGAPFNSPNVTILFSADGGRNFNYVLAATTANDGTEAVVIPNIITSAGRVMVRSIGNIFFNINTANITITSPCAAEGAVLNPSATVSGSPGSPVLNMSSAPNYGAAVFPTSGASLTTADPMSTLTVFSSVTGSCFNFNGNLFRYDTYSFQVTVAGNYTFSKTAGSTVFNIYSGPFSSGAPCGNFLASNATYDGSSVALSNTITITLLPGIPYTLAFGTFSSSVPVLPHAYTLSVTATPPGGSVVSGYVNPGGSYSYRYVVVNNATNIIVEIRTTPDLSNSGTYPTGTYTVYGFSYLTANFPIGTLNSYVGGSFAALRTDLSNLPATRCGNLSKNAVTVNVFLVLPIDLLPLTAVKEDQRVKLYWATATEINSRHFEIQRSADGRSFTTIKIVQASGNSTSRINYTTYDENPLPGTAYYRIKAISVDDKITYTNIAVVKSLVKGFDVKMYPNPVKDKSTLEILATQKGSAVLAISSSEGKVIYKELIQLEKGLNVRSLNMNKFPQGIYHVKIATDEQVIVLKAIKM